MKISILKNSAISAGGSLLCAVAIMFIGAIIAVNTGDPSSLLPIIIYVGALLVGSICSLLAIKLSRGEKTILTVALSAAAVILLTAIIGAAAKGASRDGATNFFITAGILAAGTALTAAALLYHPKKRSHKNNSARRAAKRRAR